VRAADGGEQQRIPLRRDDAVEGRVNGHVQLFQMPSARAESPKEIAWVCEVKQEPAWVIEPTN
jgi:hypothetical protein